MDPTDPLYGLDEEEGAEPNGGVNGCVSRVLFPPAVNDPVLNCTVRETLGAIAVAQVLP